MRFPPAIKEYIILSTILSVSGSFETTDSDKAFSMIGNFSAKYPFKSNVDAAVVVSTTAFSDDVDANNTDEVVYAVGCVQIPLRLLCNGESEFFGTITYPVIAVDDRNTVKRMMILQLLLWRTADVDIV